jgi:hypothetical protein
MQRKRLMVLAGLALLFYFGTLPVYSMPIPPDRVEEVLEAFSGGFLPFEQVSVSLGDEAGSYSICWVSSIADTPSVQYMGQQFIGKTVTYQRASLKYPLYASGNIHKVLTSLRSAIQTLAVRALPRSPPLDVQVQISGVPDSSNVSYQLAVGETLDSIRSFLTPPKVAADSRITIAVVGDWGQTDNSVKTGQHMLESNSTITLIAGDLSYADGFQPYWDSWGRMAEGLLSSRPFMAAPGFQHKSPSLFPLAPCPASHPAFLRKPRNRGELAA